MIQRAFRYRLYPTAPQAKLMEETANARRFVWNICLEQRRVFWRQAKAAGVTFNFVTQGRELTALRRELPWLGAISISPLTQALRDLDRAYTAFFRGFTRIPGFLSKDRAMAFRHQGREVRFETRSAKWAYIRIPKIGLVKMRVTRAWAGRIVNANFARTALGWHVALSCEIEHEAAPTVLPTVGIDRGVTHTISLSTGEHLSTPCTAALERKKKRVQRILARRVRGSGRYRKQRANLIRLTAKIARVRADWRHKTTTDIARRYGCAVIEALNTRAMTTAGTGKRGLNRSILEQGWAAFARDLAYKLEERGGSLVKVDPKYTSQTCSACGVVDKASRESQSSFACRHCGHRANADHNAALNILRRHAPGVEGRGCAPEEARTETVGLAA